MPNSSVALRRSRAMTSEQRPPLPVPEVAKHLSAAKCSARNGDTRHPYGAGEVRWQMHG
jgi:hypothetical protein